MKLFKADCLKCGGTGERHNGYHVYPCDCGIKVTDMIKAAAAKRDKETTLADAISNETGGETMITAGQIKTDGEKVQLSLNDYQTISGRTANRHDYELANYGLGITGEAGEVADLIKKSMFHGHEVDKNEIKKELGDVLWYLANIATLAGLTLEEIATANVDKLMKRYPNGFDKEASVNRVDTK